MWIYDDFIDRLITVNMEINKTQVKELYPGIFVKKKLVNLDQQLTYVFDLDVQDLNVIDF